MFDFMNNEYPFPSKRNVVYAKNGMVATSMPLASQAGLEILKKGGNAVDAAVATAACLTVVEPTSNGIGGDAFAIVWMNEKLYGLNSSGYSPEKLTLEVLEERNITEIPRFGFIPVMVPGIPAAWTALNKRFGKLSLLECLEPAIKYATEGYPISPTLAHHWNNAYKIYQKHCTSSEFSSWFETFAPNGRAPQEGELWKSVDHAETLKLIGKTNADAFYNGILADKIETFSLKYNGLIRKDDLMKFKPEWVDPISVNYKGFDVWEIPPNGQGIVALQALKIIENIDISEMSDSKRLHTQIEAMKLAFKDAQTYIADPKSMKLDYLSLLDPNYCLKQSRKITSTALNFEDILPFGSGTVYLATADKEGNMVSYIQSNYMGFGSGLVVPGTGIALQNRGHNFSLDKTHPNCLGPRKRSYHTIIPGFLTKNDRAIGPFGVMGGFMQPQGHMQVIMNSIDFHMNPQSALDAPRWQWLEKNKVAMEDSWSQAVLDELRNIGHEIIVLSDLSSFGRGEIIWKDQESSIYMGGSEPRCDAIISCW